MIETCGFQPLIVTTQEHILTSKTVSKKKFKIRFPRASLKRDTRFLKTVLSCVLWAFYKLRTYFSRFKWVFGWLYFWCGPEDHQRRHFWRRKQFVKWLKKHRSQRSFQKSSAASHRGTRKADLGFFLREAFAYENMPPETHYRTLAWILVFLIDMHQTWTIWIW